MSFAFADRLRRRWAATTVGLRLVAGYATFFLASTALLAWLAYALFDRFLREPDRDAMRSRAYELAAIYEREGIDALRRELLARGDDDDEMLVRLVGAAGETELLSSPEPWSAAELGALEALARPQREAWVRLDAAGDDEGREALAVALSGGRMLQVGMEGDRREDALESMRDVFLSIALPVLALALLGGALMAYRALRPVRQLAATLHAVIETGDVKTRVGGSRDDRGEFAELVRLFDQMLERVETLVEGLRGTLDSVAHDLRTPLTRLRGGAELALSGERDPAAYREALADTIESADAVIAILDTLMEVAEAEAGTLRLRLAAVDVRELTGDVVDLYALLAEEKGISLESHVPAGLGVLADRGRLRQALANLVDNAIKYTPPAGRVVLEAERVDDRVELRVRDTGGGIAPSDLPRIWDRLYRGDRSRSTRGLGLGLSVVRAIVEAHGGEVTAESREGAGSTFTVRLPAAQLTEL